MEMNILKYMAFLKTVETGSFTKAAELLNYSQSGVSRMISDLEREWRITLLERDRTGIRLTSDGSRLLPYAQSLCTEYQKLQIQLSRIVLSHLADKGIGQEQLLAYNALSSYKIEFLYSGKEKLDPTFNYGLNYSDLSVIHRKTKLSYLYMFTGIEESYGELVAEVCGDK